MAQAFSIAIIVSEFNREITQKLWHGAYEYLMACGFSKQDVLLVEVPGAIEIPITAQRLAKSGRFEVIVALGAVIRGETSHYDYVCRIVSDGCLRVALDFDLPVIFGVLTTENEQQAWDRVGGVHGHKGIEAVDCALKMQQVLTHI